jgi:hypothetical protein
MRFLDREWLRVVLLNVKQQLIKVATVSQGSVNELLAHPREVTSLVPFASSSAKLEITAGPPSSFDLNESFTLGKNSIRTVSNQPFLDRGTVRRGGLFVFFEFAAFEREKMLLHIFRAESGALAKRRGERPESARAARDETGGGFKWQAPREANEAGRGAV